MLIRQEEALRYAWMEPGRSPVHHCLAIDRLRNEWPVLYKALARAFGLPEIYRLYLLEVGINPQSTL